MVDKGTAASASAVGAGASGVGGRAGAISSALLHLPLQQKEGGRDGVEFVRVDALQHHVLRASGMMCVSGRRRPNSSRSNTPPTAHLFKAELLELVEQFLLLGNVYALRALQFGLRDGRQPLGRDTHLTCKPVRVCGARACVVRGRVCTLVVQGWLMMPSMVMRLAGSFWKILVIKSANSVGGRAHVIGRHEKETRVRAVRVS